MAAKSLTSANSVLTITASNRGVSTGLTSTSSALSTLSGLLGVPMTLEGWAADNAFSVDAQQRAVVVQGVDGNVHSGWVPHLNNFNLSLMPDSDSQEYLENLMAAEDTMRETLLITGVLLVPSIGRRYSLTNGTITNGTPVPTHGRILAAQATTIVFAKATPAIY